MQHSNHIKHLFSIFLIISYIILITCKLEETEEEKDDTICRYGSHKMFVWLSEKEDGNSYDGLNKYNYTFYLLSSYDNKDNLQLAFTGHFPVNVNIDISTETLYYFTSSYNFCLNDLKNLHLLTIKGDLLEQKSNTSILKGIWMQIDKIILKDKIKGDLQTDNNFYLMTDYTQTAQKVVLLKKINTVTTTGNFFQLVTATMSLRSNMENEENIIEATSIFNIINSEKNEQYLKDGKDYTSVKFQETFKWFDFYNVKSWVCLIWEIDGFKKECPM